MKTLLVLSAIMSLSVGVSAADTSTVIVTGSTNSSGTSWANTNGVNTSNNWHYSSDSNGALGGVSFGNTVTVDEYNIRQSGRSNTSGNFGSTSISLNGLTMTEGFRNLHTHATYRTRTRGEQNVDGWRADLAWGPGSFESTYSTTDETTNYGSYVRTNESFDTHITYTAIN